MSETNKKAIDIDAIMDERWAETEDDSGNYHGLSAGVDERTLAQDSINQQTLLKRIRMQNQERISGEPNEVIPEKPQLEVHLTDPKRHSPISQKVQSELEP